MGNRKDKEGEQVEKKLLRKLKAKKKVTKKISISSLSTHRHAALLGSLLTVVIAYLFFRGYTDKRRPYIYPTEPIIVQYADEVPEETAIRVLGVYPHDKEAFTQGLFFERGSFFESTGGWGGSSSIRQVDLR